MTQFIEPNQKSDLIGDVVLDWLQGLRAGILEGLLVTKSNPTGDFLLDITSGKVIINGTTVYDDETRLNTSILASQVSAPLADNVHAIAYITYAYQDTFPPASMVFGVAVNQAASPTPPAIPADSIKIADIFIDAGATGLDDAVIIPTPPMPARGNNVTDTLIERVVNSNLNIVFGGGGAFTYDGGADTLTWTSAIKLHAFTVTNQEKFMSAPMATAEIAAATLNGVGDDAIVFTLFDRTSVNDVGSPVAATAYVLDLVNPDPAAAAIFYDPANREKVVTVGFVIGGIFQARSGFGSTLPSPVANTDWFLRNDPAGNHYWSVIGFGTLDVGKRGYGLISGLEADAVAGNANVTIESGVFRTMAGRTVTVPSQQAVDFTGQPADDYFIYWDNPTGTFLFNYYNSVSLANANDFDAMPILACSWDGVNITRVEPLIGNLVYSAWAGTYEDAPGQMSIETVHVDRSDDVLRSQFKSTWQAMAWASALGGGNARVRDIVVHDDVISTTPVYDKLTNGNSVFPITRTQVTVTFNAASLTVVGDANARFIRDLEPGMWVFLPSGGGYREVASVADDTTFDVTVLPGASTSAGLQIVVGKGPRRKTINFNDSFIPTVTSPGPLENINIVGGSAVQHIVIGAATAGYPEMDAAIEGKSTSSGRNVSFEGLNVSYNQDTDIATARAVETSLIKNPGVGWSFNNCEFDGNQKLGTFLYMDFIQGGTINDDWPGVQFTNCNIHDLFPSGQGDFLYWAVTGSLNPRGVLRFANCNIGHNIKTLAHFRCENNAFADVVHLEFDHCELAVETNLMEQYVDTDGAGIGGPVLVASDPRYINMRIEGGRLVSGGPLVGQPNSGGPPGRNIVLDGVQIRNSMTLDGIRLALGCVCTNSGTIAGHEDCLVVASDFDTNATYVDPGHPSYPALRDLDVKGGFTAVADLTERNALPQELQKVGMFVYQVDTTTLYRLTATGNPGTFAEVLFDGNYRPVADATARVNLPLIEQQEGTMFYQQDTDQLFILDTPEAPPITNPNNFSEMAYFRKEGTASFYQFEKASGDVDVSIKAAGASGDAIIGAFATNVSPGDAKFSAAAGGGLFELIARNSAPVLFEITGDAGSHALQIKANNTAAFDFHEDGRFEISGGAVTRVKVSRNTAYPGDAAAADGYIELENLNATETNRFAGIHINMGTDKLWQVGGKSAGANSYYQLDGKTNGTGGEYRRHLRISQQDSGPGLGVQFGESSTYYCEDFILQGPWDANTRLWFGVNNATALLSTRFEGEIGPGMTNPPAGRVAHFGQSVTVGGNDSDEIMQLRMYQTIDRAAFLAITATNLNVGTGVYPGGANTLPIWDKGAGDFAFKVAITNTGGVRTIAWIRAFAVP